MTKNKKEKLNFALPDGHLMVHILSFIKNSGIGFEGYAEQNKRPVMYLKTEYAKKIIERPDMVYAKVVRPQDMPAHVANGNFDLAISGTDWLFEHKIRFPSSPVESEPVLKLGFGKVKIVAAVHNTQVKSGETIADFIRNFREENGKKYLRIASEYVYIADNYAQKNNLHPYRIIMTYGATESLIPEDCDMIIENTETGNTLRKNNLSITDVLMESQGCLIANSESIKSSLIKQELIQGIKTLFKACPDSKEKR